MKLDVSFSVSCVHGTSLKILEAFPQLRAEIPYSHGVPHRSPVAIRPVCSAYSSFRFRIRALVVVLVNVVLSLGKGFAFGRAASVSAIRSFSSRIDRMLIVSHSNTHNSR